MKTAARGILAFSLVLAVSHLLLWAGPESAGAPRSSDNGEVVTNTIGMKLALIPAGRFRMGSPVSEKERDADEWPHEVAITKPFYLSVYEVTQRQYQQVMGNNPSFFSPSRAGGPDHPVDQVLWKEAVQFCQNLSALPAEQQAGRTYRLPTEAEWEYACRAGTRTVFHSGDSLSSLQANFDGRSPYGNAPPGPNLGRTTRVGSYPPNAFGLHDMHGNVQEWCSDWYDPDYYRHSPIKDPPGPARGVLHTGFESHYFLVVRGGSWLDEGRGCRAAYRFRFMPSDRYRLVGFRVVGVPGARAR
jgi:formylglycine-generating enzyme required for sulfatase activity